VSTELTAKSVAALALTLEDVGAITPKESVAGMLAIIDKATKEGQGGKFWSYTGEEMTY
jgi:hypothetical protein